MTPTDHMSHSLPYRRRMISGAMERTEPANAVRGALPGLCIVATPKSIILMGDLISSPENIICSAYICECEGNKNNSIQFNYYTIFGKYGEIQNSTPLPTSLTFRSR
jgi:hypothetical protein